ncbi:tRNA U34 5-methylaminomethyl-2-thiouridine-forming methyltransferase MnmC [Loktanella sp. PT4BL]|jgi:tRNA U34 5-methylaminomethyl-2-thiouridine-forming methyltransferase MnmC|uniref:tRNA (5-methylaminomethyl-2-thiouridine)(34)-methyltransferase MnmD n=1 Tax=Loktanella sp. PT4BL TaxID=2135611 RepID=UPI000D75A498|nr:tRNA (5-methylaminomethyl-2-thiouridine)(34)-methyltransferase MnmD [Loktanella sp. PT4BL]PXW68692.1 tRNA U34 5-methylaminomethyl-2-thiouridine-forming methyltransferase MnmC [Loktanella sp. PT4BL]
MTDQRARIEWRDGVPIAQAFDDPYYSLDNGVAETQHVFLAGNDLPARFGGNFQIAELGFGTGLNLLVTWAAWDKAGQPGTLSFTSFEAFPMAADDMAAALGHFAELAPYAKALLAAWKPQSGAIQLPNGPMLEVITGDARETLPAWDKQANAWFLDGFSPAKNPELWEPTLLAAVGTHTKRGGTAATYSAAGAVRQALSGAGFEVTRVAGFGRKRHMTRARMPDAK